MYSGIIFLAALQAAVMFVALIVPAQRSYSERILGVLLGVIAIEIGTAAVVFTGQIDQWPHLLRVNTPLGFLYGPLCYWFCATVVDGKYRLSRTVWWHLLPAIMVAAYLLPLYAATADQKLAYLGILQQQPLPLDSHLIGGLKRLQIFCYLLACAGLLLTAQQAARNLLAAMLVLVGMALLWLGDVFDYLFDFGFGTPVDRLQMLALAFSVLLLTLSALIRAQILSRPHREYSSSGISTAERKEMAESLRRLFDHERLHLDPRLTLPKLAEQLRTTPHQVSRLLNEHYGANFSSFVNRHRVVEAQHLLEDGANRISDVAYSSGFNSISTFNAAFKRCTGMTPRQYRNRIIASGSEVTNL